jgi:hypothetical protein
VRRGLWTKGYGSLWKLKSPGNNSLWIP